MSGFVGTTRIIVAVAGASLISYGAWLVYQPAGFIAAGVILLTLSLFGALRDRSA